MKPRREAAPPLHRNSSDVHPKNRPASYNPVMEKWFNYSYLANVLAPKPIVYIVRTHDGKYAKLTAQ